MRLGGSGAVRATAAGATAGAIAAGAIAAGIVAAGVGAGLVRGPVAVGMLVVVWVLVPSASSFALRLALNGALALGVMPMLWWVRIPPVLGIGRVGIVMALAVGLVVGMLVAGGRSRRAIRPIWHSSAWLPIAVGAVGIAFFLPFFQARSAAATLAMIISGFGGDNVAHFDMFEMIRRMFVVGPGWGTPHDGSVYAYVDYPQHFHALAAGAAEAWAGVDVGGSELALFGIGTALVLVAGLVTLVAAVAALDVFANRPSFAAVGATACLSILILGIGASNLTFGFPGFLLAIMATIAATVLAMTKAHTSPIRFAAIGALAVLVAHSWALLAPLAAVAVLVAIVRMPWRLFASRRVSWVAPLVIAVGVAGGWIYGISLVLAATSSAGSPQAALGTTGGVAPLPIPVAVAMGIALLAIAVATVKPGARGGDWAFFVTAAGVAFVGLAEGLGLLALQLIRAHFISYFQYKIFNALTPIFVILLVVVVSGWLARKVAPGMALARRSSDGKVTAPARSLRRVASVALICIAAVCYSGIPTGGAKSLVGLQFPGEAFQLGLEAGAANVGPGLDRLINASQVMAGEPCIRPFYFAGVEGDFALGESNQWAMSLSSTWTERGSDITTRFFEQAAAGQTPTTADELLASDSARCAVVAPASAAAE